MTEYRPREITKRLLAAQQRMPVVILSGMRQTGKSTLLQNEPAVVQGRSYHTLDDFATLAAAQSHPESLLKSAVILDEVQRCPELLLRIKQSIDIERKPGRFTLSGSANLSLLEHSAETLAGRAVYLVLHPMTRREIMGTAKKPPFLLQFLSGQSVPDITTYTINDAEVLTGGLPPVCLNPSYASEWFRGYVQTYVERDVRQLSAISDLVSFQTLAQLTALRTSQVLVISSIARDAKLSAATASRYFDLLELSFLTKRLPPFLKNRSSRLIKSPKIHFTDSGLAAYMAGISSFEPGRDDLLRGALYETYAVQNLAAILEAHLPDAHLSFWHEQGRHEVDLVIESGRSVIGIEVKAATQWREHDLGSLRAFLERTPACSHVILAYNGKRTVQLGDKLWAIPLGLLLA